MCNTKNVQLKVQRAQRAEALSQTEVLSLVLAGQERFPISVLVAAELFEKELRRLSSSGWRGWSGFFRIDSLFRALRSTAASMVSSFQSWIILISFFSLLVLPALMLAPQQATA